MLVLEEVTLDQKVTMKKILNITMTTVVSTSYWNKHEIPHLEISYLHLQKKKTIMIFTKSH